ncbi:MAG: M20/M25/M40 family metallo-hydrolase [Acidobacteria bacterium]|nr:MAG: M20/M25/M40 family metallo-hydrolase [Acidobacteriota bacterium]REK01870.1 MAG: M20/M25/M40 family metallo-hydrolase [Acidobacteriota bacterium]REK14826.1 MAG: M20/M25/M40 family metallo-hydrolase [Acidobacteriota bacterium]REK45541.1 MAG: M20/M25/M40 family metallo-hydrolase [Acidobacteriota bacterium]
MVLQSAPLTLAQNGSAKPAEKNAAVNAAIRKEAMENSQIKKTLHYFTDVYGPRLTGSPKLKKAGEWAMKQMKEWGFDRTEMEPWDWGHPGWENDRASGFLISPVKDSLVFEVLAWTPSTNGAVTAEAVKMEFPQVQVITQEALDSFFAEQRSRISGKIVLFGAPRDVNVSFDDPAKRIDEKILAERLKPAEAPQAGPPRARPEPQPGQLSFGDVLSQLDAFLKDAGVLVRINDAGRPHGQIRAFGNRSYDPSTSVPTVVMRNEDYGRIWRLMENGNDVKLEFDIQNSVYPEGATSYNTIGEIKGTDKADEVIMLGGHLDAWHSATGATDNGIGCAVMMEAARILKAIDAKPRRTIRVALWSGEEQGLLGSQAYVEKHFGTAENPKPAYSKFGGYFNIDSGTGRARAMTVFGPPEAAAILGDIVAPFSDLKIAGATNTLSRRLGGSDHTSFNRAGLPGIGVLQDPIEYFTHTWHTNLDTYERIVDEDVKASAAIVAAAVYELAMRDELLPRVQKSSMPAVD